MLCHDFAVSLVRVPGDYSIFTMVRQTTGSKILPWSGVGLVMLKVEAES